MPNHSRVKVFLVAVGCLLSLGGLLLLIGNQTEIISVPIILVVIAILTGIILLIVGKNLETSAPSMEQPATRVFPRREEVGLLKPPTQTAARLTQSLGEASGQQTNSNLTRLRSNLLVKCLSNQRQVERLVEFERRLSPSASEEQLLQLAIDRWERDNR